MLMAAAGDRQQAAADEIYGDDASSDSIEVSTDEC
jgi:hypothetical protein